MYELRCSSFVDNKGNSTYSQDMLAVSFNDIRRNDSALGDNNKTKKEHSMSPIVTRPSLPSDAKSTTLCGQIFRS